MSNEGAYITLNRMHKVLPLFKKEIVDKSVDRGEGNRSEIEEYYDEYPPFFEVKSWGITVVAGEDYDVYEEYDTSSFKKKIEALEEKYK